MMNEDYAVKSSVFPDGGASTYLRSIINATFGMRNEGGHLAYEATGVA